MFTKKFQDISYPYFRNEETDMEKLTNILKIVRLVSGKGRMLI